MNTYFLIHALSEKMFVEMGIIFLLFCVCWLFVFMLGTEFLKVKIKIGKLILPALGMAVYTFLIKPFIPYLSGFIMLLPVTLFLKLITKKNIFMVIVTSILTVLINGLGSAIIAGPLFLLLAKGAYVKILALNFGFYCIILNSFIEITLPVIAFAILRKIETPLISPVTKVGFIDYIIIIVLVALYFQAFNATMNFLTDLQKGSNLLKGSISQFIAAIAAIFGVIIIIENMKQRIEWLVFDNKELEVFKDKVKKENQELLSLCEQLKSKPFNVNPEFKARIKNASLDILHGFNELAQIVYQEEDKDNSPNQKGKIVPFKPVK